MADPVSWLLVERGWVVDDRDGNQVGTVAEVLGELDADLFDGLAIRTRLLGKPLYVAAERVTQIFEGRIETDLAPDEVERLAEHDPA